MQEKSILLLSIHSQYAERIFNGAKTVELRRVRPRVQEGDWVLVYVPSPVKAIVGGFRVRSVVEAEPRDLWCRVKHFACVSRQKFDTYYAGASIGFGIFLYNPRLLKHPISLGYLRQFWPSFRAPQGYHYVPIDAISFLGITDQMLTVTGME